MGAAREESGRVRVRRRQEQSCKKTADQSLHRLIFDILCNVAKTERLKSSNAINYQHNSMKQVLLLFATLEAGEVLGEHLRLRLQARVDQGEARCWDYKCLRL